MLLWAREQTCVPSKMPRTRFVGGEWVMHNLPMKAQVLVGFESMIRITIMIMTACCGRFFVVVGAGANVRPQQNAADEIRWR